MQHWEDLNVPYPNVSENRKKKFDHQSPEIGLEIKTNNPRALEKAIHGILELKGQKVETSGKGSEWFLTSPTEVAGIYTILNSI